MMNEPIMTPCECTVCGYRWEGFFPDGLHPNSVGIECKKCTERDGMRNVNGRFVQEDELKG